MGWIKLEDSFLDHPKFIEAGPLGAYLNICAIAWCNRNTTNGKIPRAQVPRLVNFEDVGEDAYTLADELVAVGLWEPIETGWLIHDYLEWQSSKEEIEAARKQRSEAGRRGGNKRAAQRKASAWLSGSLSDPSNDALSELSSEALSESSSEIQAKSKQEGRRKKEEELLLQRGHAPERPPTGPLVNDTRLNETVEILRGCDGLKLDLDLVSVSNTLAAHPPPAEHVKAAHRAVVIATAKCWTDIDAGKVLWMAFDDLAASVKREKQLGGPRAAGQPDRRSARDIRQDERRQASERLLAQHARGGTE